MKLNSEDTTILDRLAGEEAEILGRAVDWCAIASGSRNLAGLEAQRAVLEDLLGDLPGQVDSIPLADSHEVAADGELRAQHHTPALRLTVRPEAPVQVILTGHYDTVYPAESGFTRVISRADGALNGPGIADMKGGISVMLAALRAIEAHPAQANLGYRVLLSPDEEIGSLASGPLLAELAGQGHVGLTYEPAMAGGALAAERKGSGNFHVVVRGRAAHAGREFAKGRNAVAAAADLAVRLVAANDQREGVTLNVARIDGGGPLNVVPDRAVLRFNIRSPDAAAADWALAFVQQAVAATTAEGIEAHLHGGFTRPAKPFNAAQQTLFGAVKQAGALLGQEITWGSSGGVCEGNNLFAAGLPNVDTLGVRGGDIHSEAEHAWPESFVERAQLSALILAKLATGEIPATKIKEAMS
ncbi:MAG: hydrolase [Phenylobacterium sp.]|uniref:hydrolase n=1 Tax=Phenylobacterium sp. TaxID=1871053 RepID=UPI002716234D|nr:hydrolase [Phenylobacterium sp.]MDO9432040.1 hydrolase [Phenylobacterium sp.]